MRPVGDNAVMRRLTRVVQPDDYVNYAPFLGVAKSMYFALRRLGYDVRLAGNEFLRDATNVTSAHITSQAKSPQTCRPTRSSTTPNSCARTVRWSKR